MSSRPARAWGVSSTALLAGFVLMHACGEPGASRAAPVAAPVAAAVAGAGAPRAQESALAEDSPQERIEVPPPPLSEGVFPCSDCHDPDLLPSNPRRRELRIAHQEIELRHDEEHRWCLDCHDAEDRDQLRLASGVLVPFEESQRLCGQCHGDKYRDWRAGVHGRRSGNWDGAKTYLLCVHCHDSHAPAYEPIPPEPSPVRPRRTR